MPSPTKKLIVRHLKQAEGNVSSAQDALGKAYVLYPESYKEQRELLELIGSVLEQAKELVIQFRKEYR